MTTKKNATTVIDDRAGTNLFLFGAGMMSIAFNVGLAYSIYSGAMGVIFAVGVLCVEIAAWLSFRHIVRDWQNGHRVKPAVASVLFAFMAIMCLFMGWRAFETKNIEIREENAVKTRNADEFKERAEIHFAAADAAMTAAAAATRRGDKAAAEVHRATETTERARGNTERKKADDLYIDVEKRPEVPTFFAAVILIVLEGVKLFGRWSLATPTRKTPAQKAADKAAEEARPRRTYKPRRSPEQIAADKAAKEARRLAKTGGHLHAAT